MKRRLLNLLTVLSLLLCVAVCVLWVRSYWAVDACRFVTYDRSDSRRTVLSAEMRPGVVRGVIRLTWERSSGMTVTEAAAEKADLTPGWGYTRYPPDPLDFDFVPPDPFNKLGFCHVRWSGPAPGFSSAAMSLYEFTAPWWSIALPAAALPAAWCWHRWRSRARMRAGHCPGCGYDLRATPGRCPECGAAPVASTVQQ